MMRERYWDGAEVHEIEVTERRSMAGYTGGVEYRVSYRLPDGRWLNGIRHKDRGILLTDIKISRRPWVSAA